MKLTSLAALEAHSRIRHNRVSADPVLNATEQYHLGLLRENYQEVTFYFYQTQSGLAKAYKRLQASLNALACTIRPLSPGLQKRFWASVSEDAVCSRFVQTRLNDSVQEPSQSKTASKCFSQTNHHPPQTNR